MSLPMSRRGFLGSAATAAVAPVAAAAAPVGPIRKPAEECTEGLWCAEGFVAHVEAALHQCKRAVREKCSCQRCRRLAAVQPSLQRLHDEVWATIGDWPGAEFAITNALMARGRVTERHNEKGHEEAVLALWAFRDARDDLIEAHGADCGCCACCETDAWVNVMQGMRSLLEGELYGVDELQALYAQATGKPAPRDD